MSDLRIGSGCVCSLRMNKADGPGFDPAFPSPGLHPHHAPSPRKGSGRWFLPMHVTPNQGQSLHVKIHPVLYQYNIPMQTSLCFYLECGHPTLGSYTAFLHRDTGKTKHYINISCNGVERDRDSPKLRCPAAALSSAGARR